MTPELFITPGPLNMLFTPTVIQVSHDEGLHQGRWNGDSKWVDSYVLKAEPGTSLAVQ